MRPQTAPFLHCAIRLCLSVIRHLVGKIGRRSALNWYLKSSFYHKNDFLFTRTKTIVKFFCLIIKLRVHFCLWGKLLERLLYISGSQPGWREPMGTVKSSRGAANFKVKACIFRILELLSLFWPTKVITSKLYPNAANAKISLITGTKTNISAA